MRLKSRALAVGLRSPIDSTKRTRLPVRASSTAMCCLLVQKGLSQSAVETSTTSGNFKRPSTWVKA
jgi:hypothetical protein